MRELLTQYGRIDLLALDFSYGEFQGERWGATDLVRLIRSLQPGILLNDRLQPDAIKLHPRPAWAGDFDSTELVIPRRPVLSAAGERIPFDAWFPLGDTWFHSEGSQYFKPWPMLVRSLVNAVSKDGCLHLNLAPDARGRIDDRQRAELAGLGRWLAVNRESVRGAGPADLPKPEWGRWTARAGQLYAHILEPPVGHLCLPGLDGHVSAPVRLDQGPVRLTGYWNPGIQSFDQPGDVFLTFGDFAGGTHPLPDSPDTVVRMPWDGRSGGASSG